MGRIRSAVDELRHHEMGHMGDERAALLAAGITRDIGWIVANCELAPAADAALHPIIGRLAAAAAALKSQIGRASCRERGGPYVENSVVAVALKKKKDKKNIQK